MRDFFFEIPLFWLVTDFNKLLGGMWMDNPHVLLEYERLRNKEGEFGNIVVLIKYMTTVLDKKDMKCLN